MVRWIVAFSRSSQCSIDKGTRCSFVVRAFAIDAMGRRIDPSMVDPLSYFSFLPVLYDWCNKAMMCVILSMSRYI